MEIIERKLCLCPDGEVIQLMRTPNGWVCPVCGTDTLTEEPFDSEGMSSHELCSVCHTHFGSDDVSAGIITKYGMWKKLRFSYLESAHWAEDVLTRITTNLCVSRRWFDIDIDVYKRQRGENELRN